MSISYKRTTEKEKNGQITTRTSGYESGKGFYSASSTRPINQGNKPPIVGPAAIVVATVSAVGAGVELIKKITEARKANKVAQLENSVRNSAENLDINQCNYKK